MEDRTYYIHVRIEGDRPNLRIEGPENLRGHYTDMVEWGYHLSLVQIMSFFEVRVCDGKGVAISAKLFPRALPILMAVQSTLTKRPWRKDYAE